MDPITTKILSIVQTILILMGQLLASQPVAPSPGVSNIPFLPKTQFVQKLSSAPSQNLGAYNPSSGGTYRLKSSVGTTDNTVPLSSFKEPISNISYTMSYLNSTIEYGTLEPGNSTKKELISFTGITQNSDGSATLTGVVRGLSFSYPYTASTTLQLTHSGQSVFILSDAPGLFTQYANKSNTELISGSWAFSTAPSSTVECVAAAEYCTKTYIDGGINQGAATSTEINMGIVQLATNANLAAGTASSSTGAPLVPANRSVNSVYVGTANNIIPITRTNNGLTNTIDPNFIATSSPYIFATTTIYQANIGNLTATGTTNIFNSLGAASGTIPISNGSGTTRFLNPGWDLLARQSYGAVASTTISFPPRSRLMVLFDNNGVASLTNGTSLSFNASSTRYSGARLVDGVQPVAGNTAYGNQTATQWGPNGTTSPSSIIMFITNATSSVKKATYTGSFASPTGVAETMSGAINWSGLNDQINQISFGADRWGDAQTNTFVSGATIEVYGSNQP